MTVKTQKFVRGGNCLSLLDALIIHEDLQVKKNRQHSRQRMVTGDCEDFKVLLGPLARNYTETELQQLHVEMKAMAEILLDHHVLKSGR
jgi:hypothetical protein